MKEFGPDYYNITEMLTEEELLIQKTANDFVLNAVSYTHLTLPTNREV